MVGFPFTVRIRLLKRHLQAADAAVAKKAQEEAAAAQKKVRDDAAPANFAFICMKNP